MSGPRRAGILEPRATSLISLPENATQEAEAMSYFGGGRRKEQRHADSPGRRLMPAELAEAAAAMGLPVSSNRYEPETTEGRNMQKSAIEEIKELKARMESV